MYKDFAILCIMIPSIGSNRSIIRLDIYVRSNRVGPVDCVPGAEKENKD